MSSSSSLSAYCNWLRSISLYVTKSPNHLILCDPSWHGHLGKINSSPPGQNGRHFAIIFSYAFAWILIENFTEFCSYESNWQYPSMGLDNGLAPNKRQAIVWANAAPIHWRIYAALGGDVLRHKAREWLIRETWPRLIFLYNPIFRI